MISEKLKRTLSVGAKVSFSVALVYFFSKTVDIDAAFNTRPLAALATALVVCLSALVIQTATTAKRLYLALKADGLNLSFFNVWLYCQYGGFASHTPASFIGGDLVKAKYIMKHGGSLGSVIEVLLRDRLVGFISLVSLVTISTVVSYLYGSYVEHVVPLAILSGICLFGIVAVFLLPSFRLPGSSRLGILGRALEILMFTRKFRQSPGLFAKMFGLSLLIHLCSILGFLLTLYSLGQDFNASILFSISSAFLIALLASMVPISIAGWGVREGVLLIFLDKIVADSSLIFVAAVIFGLASFLALCLWFFPYSLSSVKKWLRSLSSSRA